jgi:hypothetical protein
MQLKFSEHDSGSSIVTRLQASKFGNGESSEEVIAVFGVDGGCVDPEKIPVE